MPFAKLQLPLEESYWQLMESKIADCVNAGSREAGSILAALFLQQFAPEKAEWGHVDIAGACWDWRSGKLATGFGVSLLSQLVLDHAMRK
jgi:leucyl aminopeptidase